MFFLTGQIKATFSCQITSAAPIMRSYGACNQNHQVQRAPASYTTKTMLLFVVSALVLASTITIVAYRRGRTQLLQSEMQLPSGLHKVVDFKLIFPFFGSI